MDNQVEPRGCSGSEVLCVILPQWAHDTVHLSKPTELHKIEVNPDVNYRLWFIRLYQY